MEIRLTQESDIPAIPAIYDAARRFMRSTGNMYQWSAVYPSLESLEQDMARGASYVCVESGRAVATFFFAVADDPTYKVIEGGHWLNDEPYGVIHRIASDGSVKGVLRHVLDFCFSKVANIRIDTHHDNKLMHSALLRYGFCYCGIIHLANGHERLAYHRIKPKP